jgi:hypothetical protein
MAGEPTHASAQRPPNDDVSNAAEISGGLPLEATGSNVGATAEPGEPSHGSGPPEHTIWFKWTAPAGTGVSVRSFGCAPPFHETGGPPLVTAVYTHSEVFGYHAVSAGGGPFRAMAGTTYWIVVDTPAGIGFPGQPSEDPDICVRLIPGPVNDDFEHGTPLQGFPATATQLIDTGESPSSGGPTREPGEPAHGGDSVSGSIWYRWSAPADMRVMLRACGNAEVLAVYRGESVDALTSVATTHPHSLECVDQRGARVQLDATGGETYRIAVLGPVVDSGAYAGELSIGSQLVVTRRGRLSYRAFRGDADHVSVGLEGTRAHRALVVKARGVTAALGCTSGSALGVLRCPVPGRGPLWLDMTLRAGDDSADVRLAGTTDASVRVRGGDGDDELRVWAPSLRLTNPGPVLLGGDGADRLVGGPGADTLSGGPGADRLEGGEGNDLLFGGLGRNELFPGGGRDVVQGGPHRDRVVATDGMTDIVRCRFGSDSAVVDGIDLPTRECERRALSEAPRAAALGAVLSNDDGDSSEHVNIRIGCPIDVARGCSATVTPMARGRAAGRRRIGLDPGRTR